MTAASKLVIESCVVPSRYRYQRGCRCPGCSEAAARYKRERREKKAAAEGRVHGEKPCARCDKPFSVFGSSNARKHCEPCAALLLKERRAADRKRRDEQHPGKHVEYMREYWRANKERLRIKQREYYDSHRESIAEYYRRRRKELREYKRSRYTKKNTPTVHERALEAFGFKTSGESGGAAGRPRGFGLYRCKCGCGMPVNAAHIAVVRLFKMGYTRQEIGERLGIHPSDVSQLKLDGEAQTWPWYRRGHGNLGGLQRRPVKTRRRVSKDIELRLLIEEQETEDSFGPSQNTITRRSLDATLAGTDGLTIGDLAAAPDRSGDTSAFADPVFDEVAERVLWDTARLLALVKKAPIVPTNVIERLRKGELTVVTTDSDPYFIVPIQRDKNDAVPWQDFAGPIPSMAIMSAGGMAHHAKARKQKQKLARGSHGHGSRKSKSAA